MQTLGLTERPVSQTPGVPAPGAAITLLWMVLSPVTVPLLLLAGAISIPWTAVALGLQRRAERRFLREMGVIGRFMTLADFLRAGEERRGTLIEEEHGFGCGLTRWWWTPDQVTARRTPPADDELMPWEGEGWREYSAWCCAEYTDPHGGSAKLLGCSALQQRGDPLVQAVSSPAIPLLKVARWPERAGKR